jgi:hypothetical protein
MKITFTKVNQKVKAIFKLRGNRTERSWRIAQYSVLCFQSSGSNEGENMDTPL